MKKNCGLAIANGGLAIERDVSRQSAIRNRQGSALLLVLWAIVTMSLAVIGVVEYVGYNLDETQALNRDFRLRQIAESGLAFAFHPQVDSEDPLLSGALDDGGRFEVKLQSETARLNINFLIRTGREDVLERLFTNNWKLSSSDSRMVIAGLIRWMGRTGDSPETLEVFRNFDTIEQMTEVDSMAFVEEKKPDWRDSFTVLGEGRTDLNDATADIVDAIFRVGDRRAQRFVQYRLGADKKEHTLDDQKFEQISVVGSVLGIPQNQMESFNPLITLEGTISRVESTATLGNHSKLIRVILNRKTSPQLIYKWEEM
ncbi:MAG TPA: hypothetical protein VIT21_02775 [Chthoniobacterales bacterium]